MAVTSNNRWFSREACDRWWGVRMLGPYTTKSPEGGAMYRSREGFSFFLANSHNRRLRPVPLDRRRTYGASFVDAEHYMM